MAKVLSGAGLVLTLGPPIFVFEGIIDLDSAKLLMMLGAVGWFSSAPLWMNRLTSDAKG